MSAIPLPLFRYSGHYATHGDFRAQLGDAQQLIDTRRFVQMA